MRILLVLGTTAGGTGRHVRDLAVGLTGRGHDVTVAAPSRELDAFGFDQAGAHVRAVDVAERPSRRDAATVLRLRELVRGPGGADVVHAHGARVASLCALALTGCDIPLVTTLHNAAPEGRFTGLVHAGLERVVARRSALVLGVSRDIVARQEALGARRVRLAVVAAARPGRVRRDRYEVRAELGVQPRAALLVTIARLARQKDLGVLIDAVTTVREKGTDLLAVVAGEGPLRAELETRIAARQAPVRLLGQRHDVPDLVAAADAVISSAHWEGQPVALQEALHAGAAIVATDAGGTADVVGEAAVLVPVGNAQTLASAILDVLTHDTVRDDLRAKALRRSAELPDRDAATSAALAAYEAVLTAGSRPEVR